MTTLRDPHRFPDDLIGNRLFELQQSGCDLSAPIDVNFVVAFVAPNEDLETDHAPTRVNAERFLALARDHSPNTELLDFTNLEERWGTDLDVAVRFHRVVSHIWIKGMMDTLQVLARPFDGIVRFYAWDPEQNDPVVIFRSSER